MALFLDIEKKLGDFQLKVKLEAANETLALLGPSGCGKSMTLKCIAGIEKPDRGRILVDDVVLFDSEKKINLSPQQRRTGLLFQNYALFPNMTVFQNIRAGASRERDKNRREKAAADIMEQFELTALAAHYPHQLSGGQQQRVVLARILVSDPQMLLLDEPFSALDSHLRFRLEQEVREVICRFGKTVLLVSHDRDEVYRMADSIAIMDGGTIQTAGEKKAVFRDPKTARGAILTGCKNISRAEILDEYHVKALDWGITLKTAKPTHGVTAVGIRMHDIRLGAGENSLLTRVVEEIENPFSYTVMVQTKDQSSPMGVELGKEQWNGVRGETLQICLPSEAILLLGDGQGKE